MFMKNDAVMSANAVSAELLSVREAAQKFGVTEYFLRKGLKTGIISHIRNGRKYYICVEALSNVLRYGQKNK